MNLFYDQETRFEKWVRTICICVMLGVVAFMANSCKQELGTNIAVEQYDGYKQKCEQAGGVFVDKLCIEPSSLIDIE